MGRDRFGELGLAPSAWDAGPGTVFGVHDHPQTKLLVCRAGAIRFTLEPGGEVRDQVTDDWIELPAGQRHSAVAGPAGVRCEEAFSD